MNILHNYLLCSLTSFHTSNIHCSFSVVIGHLHIFYNLELLSLLEIGQTWVWRLGSSIDPTRSTTTPHTVKDLRFYPVGKPIKLAYPTFMDASRKHEIPGSETKDSMTHSNGSSQRIFIWPSSPRPTSQRAALTSPGG